MALDAALILLETQRRRRRALLRILMPLFAVLLIIASILGIALYSYTANRRGALALTEELLGTLEQRVQAQVLGFLAPAERGVRFARETFSENDLRAEPPVQLAAFGRALTRELPQIFQFLAGDTAGNYFAVRLTEQGAFRTTQIFNEPGPRRLERRITGATGQARSAEPMAENDFDPRTRPWFQTGLAARDVAWTDLYIFFEARIPGITVSAPVRHAPDAGPHGVIALDISLSVLSDFLAGLSIGRSGRAVLVDRQGRLIAHPDASKILADGPDGPRPRRLDELGDAILARAYDRMRITGQVRGVEEVDGIRHVVLARELDAGAGAVGWRLVLTAPEDDFVGFVNANNRNALALSLGVVALALGLAVLLVRQGLRADAVSRRLAREEAAIGAQSHAFAELAASPALLDATQPLPPLLTEQLVAMSGAARASIWRLEDAGRRLRCEDSFEAGRGHATGAELLRDELPAFFARLAQGNRIASRNASGDRGLVELHRLWLHPLRSQGLMAQPIMQGAQPLGIAWLEDPRADDGQAAEFLAAIANLLTLRLANLPRGATGAAAAEREALPALAALRTPALLAAPPVLDADVFPGTAVMLARFDDPMALGRGAEGRTATLCRVAEAARAHGRDEGMPYLAIMADQIVAASGFTAEESGMPAARRVARFALLLRAEWLRILDEADQQPHFRIGIDLGTAIGTPLASGGDEAPRFNLWGDAVRLADHMAGTAPDASIQASEAVHAAIAGEFLFRPRGAFHMPRIGVRQTFVLAARL